MTATQLSLFASSAPLTPLTTPDHRCPPIRREPSDPELWEAVLHPDGYRRTEALLDRRHGDDAAAKLAGLRAFRAPNRYQTTDPRSEHWAGWMVVLESKLEGRMV